MGLPATMAVNEGGIQFCVFDSRRGQQEGQELDKILFFYPPDYPYSEQLSVVGLSGGLITFTRIFSPDADCEIIEEERHSHVFYQAEPDVWMILTYLRWPFSGEVNRALLLSLLEAVCHLFVTVLLSHGRGGCYKLEPLVYTLLSSIPLSKMQIVEKNKESESIWRSDGLQDILKEVHSLFTMFNGPLQTLLDKQPSGELARSRLYTFITDYLTDFQVGKRFQMPSFRDCLKERKTVQMLTVSREVAIEVQSLASLIGSSCFGSIMCKSLILFHDLVVATTLSPDDTANMFAYALLRLTPRALSSNTSSWSYLRKGVSVSNFTATSALIDAGSSPEEYQHGSRDGSPGAHDQIYYTPRPLQRGKWSKGKDGFLYSDTQGEVGSLARITPVVWLKQTEEHMYLCVYQHRNLTIVLLIPVSSLIDREQGTALIKKQLLENASEKIVRLDEKLSRGWGGENAYHVSGYRYLLVDRDSRTSRASPAGKVTTLAKDSLLALNKLREEVDLEKARANREKPGHENNFEMCIRAKNNAWIIAKLAQGRELYMALEKANETLLYASDAVEKFSDRYCDGAFSLD